MGARSIFRGGQIRGVGSKVPEQGAQMEPLWGLRAKSPEADDWCENNAK